MAVSSVWNSRHSFLGSEQNRLSTRETGTKVERQLSDLDEKLQKMIAVRQDPKFSDARTIVEKCKDNIKTALSGSLGRSPDQPVTPVNEENIHTHHSNRL